MNCNALWAGRSRDRCIGLVSCIGPVSGRNEMHEIQNVDIAHTKEKTLKKLEKSVDFSVGICYYNTRLERQGKTY